MLNRYKLLKVVTICLALFMVLGGCGGKDRKPKAALDTPAHHVDNGYKLLAKDKVADALREFDMALELDRKYSPAYVGTGIAKAMQKDFIAAMENMKKAGKYDEGDAQKVGLDVGYIRVYTLGQSKIDKDWLDEAEDHFKDAVKLIPDNPAPYFYMGLAWKMAYRFSESARMFAKVIDIDRAFMAEADRQYAEVQKIERAMPGTSVGKKIALIDKITRGDVAALFIQELKIDELFEKRTPKKFDTSFKSPEKTFEADKIVKAQAVTDISDYVLKSDVEAVIKQDIRGLRPYPDHTFQPDKPITRAEFALMMEDILIKITGDEGLYTRFIASTSPFPDVRSDISYFNAIMVCTSRNIMAAKSRATGEFAPQDPVSGADALLGIRAMKSLIRD